LQPTSEAFLPTSRTRIAEYCKRKRKLSLEPTGSSISSLQSSALLVCAQSSSIRTARTRGINDRAVEQASTVFGQIRPQCFIMAVFDKLWGAFWRLAAPQSAPQTS
jgi:hypothetical protein